MKALILALLPLWLPASVGQAAEFPILTPKPGPQPAIRGPRVYGVRPGRPVIYRIPCTGERPIRFAADGLPSSIQLDAEKGVLRGAAPSQRGEYVITFHAVNRHGKSKRQWKLMVGDQIALTPPMGWNHWYTYYHRISDELFRQAADAMVSCGMADFGYAYVSIDDCWMTRADSPDPQLNLPPRDAAGAIRPNANFPDMMALTAYIHEKGLKAGIYTSPGPLTCARYCGSYQHEEIDARTFAAWGFDLLKYDLCSYRRIANPKTVEDHRKPYELMGRILRGLDRDIHFNLCQYGLAEVWKWAPEVGGNSWRTTGDLGLEKDTRLPGFYSIGFKNAALWEYAGPGHWNDPDYILIGVIGNARDQKAPPQPTKLTADEQYSYMSMWSLMAAPLFYSGDMSRLDAFTLNVLCNGEVIDVNQDPLGKQARIVRKTEDEFILAKPLEDGSLAVGLFNISEQPRTVRVSWAELHLKGRKRVRDVWRQKDIASVTGEVSAQVPRHGVAFLRLH
jgi:alpha-galactosidase